MNQALRNVGVIGPALGWDSGEGSSGLESSPNVLCNLVQSLPISRPVSFIKKEGGLD